jgi:RimJ/RimL family protein N-acetyltransferase
MIQIQKKALIEIDNLRETHLKSLPQFQELFLEFMVQEADVYLILEDEETVGYAIITTENTLIEFFLFKRFIPKCMMYFDLVIDTLSIENIYCKSFDSLLLNCCLINSYTYSLLGCFYRDFHDKGVVKNDQINMRLATYSDSSFLMQTQDNINELFETVDQLEAFIKSESVHLFYIQDELVGCGTTLKTHADWNYFDLGVWVSSKHRKKGIGTQVITYLRAYCLDRNWKPTCGCAIENIASQKTLEKSGFISKHKLIDFKVK